MHFVDGSIMAQINLQRLLSITLGASVNDSFLSGGQIH